MDGFSLEYDAGLQGRPARAALVWGVGMRDCAATGAVPSFLRLLLDRVREAGEDFLPPERRAAVRGMLRYGVYKPSGRSKPSSEYLLTAALQSMFPLVNPPVDVNNAVSLESGYPASIFDLDRCRPSLLMRRGLPGESYVFNPAGQSIELADLLLVCRREGDAWIPCGNPVKDSMATKTDASTRSVLAVIYAPAADPPANLEASALRFAALLVSECGASDSGWRVV